MACYGNGNCPYLPQPPREWSRVQNSCSVVTDIYIEPYVTVPLTGEVVPSVDLARKIQQLNKGNVLQYKKNSSNLTQRQRYSLIAKGQWVNRNTTWATQSTRGYTNPNNTSLKRIASFNIAINPANGVPIGTTLLPVTCPSIKVIDYPVLPPVVGGSSENPPPPPPPPPVVDSGTVIPSVPDVTPIVPIIIPDEGNLLCNVKENVCTGEIITQRADQMYNLTTDSDVPGPIEALYWNDGVPTWYPRQRYVMSNSTNKWPFTSGPPNDPPYVSAVKPYPPVITSVSFDREIVTLKWTQSEICIPVFTFEIYQNDVIVSIVDGKTFTTQLIVNNCELYTYFIRGHTNGNVVSEKSNVEQIYVSFIEPPYNLSYTTISFDTIRLNWSLSPNNCDPPVSYKIYNTSGLIGTTTNLFFVQSGLINCNIYTYYISSVDINGVESPTVSITTLVGWPNPPTNLKYAYQNAGGVLLSWDKPTNCNTPTSYNIYDCTSGTNVLYATSTTTSFLLSRLVSCSTYIFKVASVDSNKHVSDLSSPITIYYKWPQPPTNITLVKKDLVLIYNDQYNGFATIDISWSAPSYLCFTPSSYNIYINDIYDSNATITTYKTSPLPINKTYTITITTLASIDGTTYESAKSEPFDISLPVIFTTTGSPNILSNPPYTSIVLTYLNSATITYNYQLNIEFTLVGGGGAGAAGYYASGTNGGGGGQVLNSAAPITVPSDTWSLNIGAGQVGPNYTSIPSHGDDTSIVGTYDIVTGSNIVTTQNSVYGGGGGIAETYYSDQGGGGSGVKSAPGGSYYIDTAGYSSGGGGAGGSLTRINSSGTITLESIGVPGDNGNSGGGGDGGLGQLGIDGYFYGGGGGGGTTSTSLVGQGNSGGGDGASNFPTPNGTPINPATPNTGSGGGGGFGYQTPSNPYFWSPSGNGASGIIILKISAPP